MRPQDGEPRRAATGRSARAGLDRARPAGRRGPPPGARPIAVILALSALIALAAAALAPAAGATPTAGAGPAAAPAPGTSSPNAPGTPPRGAAVPDPVTAGLPELPALRAAYPDVGFAPAWDEAAGDWSLRVEAEGRSVLLYRAEGRYLAAEELPKAEDYRRLIYPYAREPADPAAFDAERVSRIAASSSAESRRAAPVTPTALHHAIYDSGTRGSVEARLRRVPFLGRHPSVHERLAAPLGRVQARIEALARAEPEVAAFVADLASVEGYAWRGIADTRARSFHSFGLALDLLPKKSGGKAIYWSWERDRGNADWMLLPLERRWMPPASVIEAFEAEGFIWGGKWTVWDNMHFEYRPELIAARELGIGAASAGRAP